MRFMLKECVWESLGDELIVVLDPREALTIADPTGNVEALLTELDRAPQTEAELCSALIRRGLQVTEADVRSGLKGLDSLGLIENAAQRWLGNPMEDERHFSNLTFFGTFSDIERSRAEYIRRLRDSHVLVLGVGGAGSCLVQCLAGLGVGAMTLVDRDDVEPRNFARQFLYRHADIGRSKVDRAAEWVRDFDPDIEVRAVDRWISGPDDLEDLTKDADLIAGGIDNTQDANLWVNEAAIRDGIPFVTGGGDRTRLMYTSVSPGNSPCLQCDLSDQFDEREPTSGAVAQRLSQKMRSSNFLIGPIAMQLGSLIAYEALRYLTGFESPRAAGVLVLLDLRTGLIPEFRPFTEDPACRICAQAPHHSSRGRGYETT